MPNATIKRKERPRAFSVPLYRQETEHVLAIAGELGLDFAPALRLIINQHRIKKLLELPSDGTPDQQLEARIAELAH